MMIARLRGNSVDVPTALRRIKRQFGDEYGVVITNDDIYGWIHDAELDIIRTTSCNDTTISVSSSTFPVDVPTSVNIKRLSVAGKALAFITVDEIDMLSLNTQSTGGIQYWYKTEGTKLNLWPVPDTASSIDIQYNKTPGMMVDPDTGNTFTVPEVYHDDVLKYCIARAHNKNNNLQAEQAQMQLYDRNLNIRRDESQSVDLTLYKGGDPMDFEVSEVEYN